MRDALADVMIVVFMILGFLALIAAIVDSRTGIDLQSIYILLYANVFYLLAILLSILRQGR